MSAQEQKKIVSGRRITPQDIPSGQASVLRQFRSWPRFATGQRSLPDPLLYRLSSFPGSVLVAGCQRSGTTMLTRAIANSPGFTSLALTHDDELDAALILCGRIDVPIELRYCFQTTYLNERVAEYASLRSDQKLIWMLRNPYAVVHSMVYNWRRFALDELFHACGRPAMEEAGFTYDPSWFRRPNVLERACWAYVGKTRQIHGIAQIVTSPQLLVLDYDQIVVSPDQWLRRAFEFIGTTYDSARAAGIQTGSQGKAQSLTAKQRTIIDRIVGDTFEEARKLVTVDA